MSTVANTSTEYKWLPTAHPNFQLTTATIMITTMMRTANAAATGPITTFIFSEDDDDTGAVLALAVVLYNHTNYCW